MSVIKKYFHVLICLILLVIGCLFIVNHQSPDFYSYLIQDISKRDRHFETIEKVKYQDNLYFIVYQDDQAQSHLLIYENVHNLWMDNYQFWGESSSSQDIDTFNYADSHQAMVVVYGKNKQNASQYSFVNNGKVYKKEMNDSYILDIYMLEGSSCHIADWTLYDQNHQIIQN